MGNLVREAENLGCDLKDLDLEVFKQIEPEIHNQILEILTIDNSVKSKKSYGGTSPTQVKERIIEWQKRMMGE